MVCICVTTCTHVYIRNAKLSHCPKVTALFSPTLLNRKSHQSRGPLHFSPAIPEVGGGERGYKWLVHYIGVVPLPTSSTSHFVYSHFVYRLLPFCLLPFRQLIFFSLKIINSIIFLEMYIAYKLKLISSEM